MTGLVVLVLGGPLGLLWAWLAPGVPVIDTGQNGIVVNDPSPEEYIAADGWFTLLGLAFGIVVAVVAWLVMRRDRGPSLLLGVVAGMLGAGYLVAPWLGEMIGRGDYERWQETAAAGATYLAPPQVHSLGPTLVPAFVAAIVLTLLAGWSNDPDLDEPGAKPGYGPNTAAAPYPTGAPYPATGPYPDGEPYATTGPYPAGQPHPAAAPYSATGPHPTGQPYPAAVPHPAGEPYTTGTPNPAREPYAAGEPSAVSGWQPVADPTAPGPTPHGPAAHTPGEPPRG